jgi:hypothetical protein
VADKSSQLVLNALTRAAAVGSAVPLHGSKAAPGLFPATALGKQAAQRCRDEGYLHTAAPAELAAGPARSRGSAPELCTLTDKGLNYLLGQVSPRQVLEDFVRVLEAREAQVVGLLAVVRQMQSGLEGLRANAEQVLRHVPASGAAAGGDLKVLFRDFLAGKTATNGAPVSSASPAEPDVSAALLAELERWAGCGATEDYPLSELFRRLHEKVPTLGAFHDALRRLHASGQVYLHPWTGPLYDIPEPPYALLVGHEVAYYASLRS